jgi:hypothetical protein
LHPFSLDDPKQNPYSLESEMLGPYALLKPGESTGFHYDWYAAKIGANLAVLDCSNVGVICEPLSAELSGDTIFDLTLKGHFGVFYKADMQMVFLDRNDREILKGPKPKFPVSPIEPVQPPKIARVGGEIHIPENAVKVALNVYDTKGRFLGELARAQILRN